MDAPGEPVTGLREPARGLDVLICDIWGVLHAGGAVFPEAVEALVRFRRERGPVALLSNAPRRAATVAAQLAERGLPDNSHDAIVTSGDIARDLIRRDWRDAALYHLGPSSDSDLKEGLPVRLVTEIESADCVLASGPSDGDGDGEATDDAALTAARRCGLTMICANPDLHVMDNGRRVACAGMLARRYEALGGRAVRTGKPEAIAFDTALAALKHAAGAPLKRSRILVIGDGLATDIRGAQQAGLASLYVTSGLPGQAPEPDLVASYTLDRLRW